MNPYWKDKWVPALRSKLYKQHRGSLTTEKNDAFCCLAVLCDLASKEGLCEWDGEVIVTDAGSDFNELPDLLRSEVFQIKLSEQDILIDMNDKEFKSFEKIADYIEANL